MVDAKPGEIVTDGRSATIGAPVITGSGGTPQTPSQALGVVLRHLKGVVASADELRKILEKQEQEQ